MKMVTIATPIRAILVIVLASRLVCADATRDVLDNAVREYRAALDSRDRDERLARFGRAALQFQLLTEGDSDAGCPPVKNADLYVNLANAALGAERLGPAILAYRRALALSPNHPRALQNLTHARSLLPNWLPRPRDRGLLDSFLGVFSSLSSPQLLMIAAVAFLLAATAFACSVRWRLTSLRNVGIVFASMWIVLLVFALWGKSGGDAGAAVVIVTEVTARSADSAGAPPRLSQPLPGGTEVEIMQTRDNWSHVWLFDGRDAWLPRSTLERVIDG